MEPDWFKMLKEVRKLQKAYYKGRSLLGSTERLHEALDYEKRCDKAIKLKQEDLDHPLLSDLGPE